MPVYILSTTFTNSDRISKYFTDETLAQLQAQLRRSYVIVGAFTEPMSNVDHILF